MKYIILILTAFFLCGAQISVLQQHLPKYNTVENPGFENNKARWTASGTSTLALETTTPLTPSTSGKWTALLSGEYLTSSAVTVHKGLQGRDCEISFTYSWDTGTAGEIQAYAYDGTNNVHEKLDLIPTDTGKVLPAYASFGCPASGTIALRLESTAATPGAITIDDVWVGTNNHMFEMSESELYGTVNTVGGSGCEWIISSTGSWQNFPADTGCNTATATGKASAPATKIPAIRFASGMEPGKYIVHFQGNFFSDTGTSCIWRVSDGTNFFGTTFSQASTNIKGIDGVFEYAAAQGDITFQPQAWNNTTNACRITNSVQQGYSIWVERFPLDSQKAISIETQGMYWSGYHGTNCKFSRTNTSYGDFTDDASCSFTEVLNQNMGTVATYGASKPGLVFTPARTGVYEICAMFGARCTNSNRYALRMYDGTNVLAETMEQEDAGSGGYPDSVMLCGFLDVTTIAEQSIRLEGSSSAGSLDVELLTGTGGVTTGSIFWTVKPITQQFPQAVVLPPTKYQYKYLASNELTEDVMLTGVAFTDLTVGQTYKIHMHFVSAPGITSNLVPRAGNTTGGAIVGPKLWAEHTAGVGENSRYASFIWKATNTSVGFHYGGQAGSQCRGDGTAQFTHFYIETLPYHQVTTEH